MTNASVLLDAIAEPTRRAIVERLADAPAAVSDLARDLPITRSAVSQHLHVLKSAGLVTSRPVGTRRVYAVDPDALAVIRAYFDSFWNRSLASFRAQRSSPRRNHDHSRAVDRGRHRGPAVGPDRQRTGTLCA